MTLANLITEGGGKLAARWEIEGLPIQIVTDPAMEQTISGGNFDTVERICVTSLTDSGFSIEESVNIPEATMDIKSTTLTMWETFDEDLANVFSHRPSIERFGAVTFSDSATTITLLSTSGISANDIIHIGTEAIKVGGVSGSDLTGCTRGFWGTEKRKHWASDTANVPELLVTNRPLRFRGRRVELYLYGDDDDLTGDGSLVWRGVVADEPRLLANGTKYQLSMSGNWALFDTKLGADLEEPAKARGCYYHDRAGLAWFISEDQAGTFVSGSGIYVGFTETQDAFLIDFNATLATATSALDGTYEAVRTTDGRWTLVNTVGANAYDMSVFSVFSEQDGLTYSGQENTGYNAPDAVRTAGRTIATGDRLFARWQLEPPGARTVPRGFFGDSPDRVLWNLLAATTTSHIRIHVSRAVSSNWTAATIEFEAFEDTGAITTADTSTNFIEWAGGNVSPDDHALYTRDLPVAINILRELVPDTRSAWAGVGTVGDAMSAIIDEAIDFGDLGTAPFIVPADVTEAIWTGVALRAAITPWQRSKRYFIANPIDLTEFLSMELRAIACYPVTSSTGTIAIRRLEIPNSLDASIVDITEEVLVIDDQAQSLSTMVRGNQTINRVVYRTGYDALEDDWSGSETVNDITAQALDHQDRALEVESRGFADVLISPEEAGAMALPVLSLFGYPHDFWAPKVPWTLFNLRLGTPVTFDAAHLPDFATGNRPITDIVGIVTSRKWKLGEAFGELSILVPWQNVAGYSPTARVNSQADQTGDLWEITVDHTKYAPLDTAGSVEANVDTFFAVADQVRVIKVDSESTTVVVGEITVINTGTHVITVQFDATWTPGADTWDLIFDKHDATGTTTGQQKFAAFAGTDLLLGSADANPRTLSA